MLKSWQKKLIAMLLIFTLTFGNFAFVGKVYATSILDGIFSEEDVGDTGSSNVEFDAYFIDKDKKENKEVKANINDDDLMMQISVNVLNTGYLKDAKVLLGNGKELNFNIVSDEIELDENIQAFENNVLSLVQLNAGSNIKIIFPLNYQNEKYVNIDKVSKSNVIKFEGTYINDEAKEIYVSKEVNLKLDWIDNREVKLNSEVTKYIPYESNGVSGLILQTLVQVDNTTNLKTLPVKNSKLDITVPVINETKASTINVVAKSTAGTNGKKDDEIVFDKENWKYNEESNIITINVKNESELVSPQSEEEILIDETIPKEERYYNVSGMDEYIITYTYENISLESLELKSNIKESYEMYGNSKKLEAEKEFVYEVSEQIGEIVTFSMESNTKSVSKGYTYLNYNNDQSKYEIEIDNKLVFNVSYKDIVESLFFQDNGNNYVTKSGDVVAQDDIYYKSLSISKDNFDLMLGENGFINVYDNTNNLLFTINKDTNVSENEKYEFKFDSLVKSLSIETSKPISDGNIIISTIRAYSNVSFEKENYKNFDKLAINTVGKAKYIYLEELADCGNAVTEVKLDNTITKAELEIGQDTLSTLAKNDNVELKIKLNNEKIESDVYGNSEFRIKLPNYIQTVEVTNASLVYGEGLELANINAYKENENMYLAVTVSGKQSALSSGIVSNGTNIVLDTNIKVDLFAPAIEEKFELTYANSEATAYDNNVNGYGYDEKKITFSAPSGVISVNSTTGYNDAGNTVTSVKQGKQTDEITVYSAERQATMELTIMNNESNAISNIKILGRVPFEGNKDIEKGNALGTTINTKMISGLVADSKNNAEFTVYYSENGDATEDLNDSANGWITQVANFETIKSYLIVPNDEAYQMQPAQKLRFTYNYLIPGELEHNQEIYGTFATYYTNNSAVATLNEISVADLVGLETGVGPQLSIETEVDKTEVNEFGQIEVTTKVVNTGKVDAKNMEVNIPIKKYLKFIEFKSSIDGVNQSIEDGNVRYKLDSFEKGRELVLTTVFDVTSYLNTADKISVYSVVTATDLDTELKSNIKDVDLKHADLKVTLSMEGTSTIFQKDDEIRLIIEVKNMGDSELKNVEVNLNVDDIFGIVDSYVMQYKSDYTGINTDKKGNYDGNSKILSWTIDSINGYGIKKEYAILKVKKLEGNSTKKDIKFVASAQANDTESYTSQGLNIVVGKPSLKISQTSTNTNSYVKEGEAINYVFSITNEGSVTAREVKLTDKVPEGLIVRNLSYKIGDKTVNKKISNNTEVNLKIPVEAGETVEVNMQAIPRNLNGVQELAVTNMGVVKEGENVVESNKITHVIEPVVDKTLYTADGVSTGISSSGLNTSNSNSLSKTYKLSGIAWLDSNNDGTRNDNEKLMKDIKATLVDSDKGVIKQTVKTNSKGEYTFTGVVNGNYIVIFDYDTVLYTVTTYRKENVTSNVNSDVITTKIEQDGVLRNGAVTEVVVIKDGSVSNIDIGLVEAMKFDLSLNMGISKITVQNSQGTKTSEYNMDKLTKTEIGAKQMAGSQVYIEYTFQVKNEGEIPGYAKRIVDYIPEGMNFNSGMNQDWYTGTDGKLYTRVLANTEITPGETKTFKLVLSKTMTNDNTGVVTNTAEIVEDYNIYGVSDNNSIPGNNAQNENDFSRADAYLSVKTGEVFIYISVIITTILLVGIAVTIVVLKLKYRVVKGGV